MSRVIDAVLRLRDEFTAPMKQSIDLMTSASKQGEKTRKAVDKIGKGFESTGKKLTASVTAPIVGLGAVAYKNFESVDKQLQMVRATMGEDKYAAADLSTALAEAMTNSIYTMEDGGNALVNYARQGWDAAQAADMLAPSLNLAAGTATDLNTVTSGLGNTLKAFGASSDEAAHYADMFTQAQAQANTNVTELIDSMSVAGPVAKTVGWDFEDIATLIGVFGDNSISASEGANALKTGLMRLSGGNSTANKALDALGISLFDDVGNMKSMVDVIDTLQYAFKDLTSQEQLEKASQLFGANQAAKWLALINGPAADALGDMRDNITNASGNAQEAADAMMTPLEKLSSTFDVFKYKVGETISTAVIPFIEKVTELVDKFRNLTPEQQQNIVKWAAIAAAAGPVLMIFGRLIHVGVTLFGAFSKIRGAFTAVSQAGGVLKAGMAAMAGPFGIVIALIAVIVAIIAVVITHLDQFKTTAQRVVSLVSPAIANLSSAFSEFGALVSPVITFIGDLLANVLCGAFMAAGQIAAFVINLIADIFHGLSGIISGVVGTISGIINADWSETWEAAKSVVSTVIDSVSGIIDGVIETVKNVVKVIKGIKDGDWTSVWEGMQGIVSGVAGVITGALDGIKNVLSGIVNVAKKAKDALAGVGSASTDGGGKQIVGRASGTPNWRGGLVRVNERGGELMNLPSGTQIIPHEASLNRHVFGDVSDLLSSAARQTPSVDSSVSMTIPKLADTIVVREDADIDRIGDAIVRKWRTAAAMRGGYSFSGDMA